MEKLKFAQDLIKTSDSSVSCGFNMFIIGDNSPLPYKYSDYNARDRGYEFAKEMANGGKIAFTHKFNCECGGYPFLYGGFWVCNDCGGKNVNKEWWKIKVEKDGNEYCCHGLDFINLQESDNYAFSKSFYQSIRDYGELMMKK